MDTEKLIDDNTLDTYFLDRQEYSAVGEGLAEIIAATVSDLQLVDIQMLLLVLAIQARRLPNAPHASALVNKMIATIRKHRPPNQSE